MVVGPVVSRKLTELPCRLTFMMRSTTLAAITSLVWLEALAVAWDFPGQKPFFLHDHNIGDVDIVSGSQFRGLQTYANLPYVNCFADREGDENSYDIAIVGAPFDTGTTGRPGARYGPGGIRIGSQRISARAAWSIYTGKNPLLSWARIVDCGDAPLTWLDNRVALAQLDKAHKVVSSRRASNITYSKTPRILTLGGDHTTTLSALRSTYARWGKTSVIHFDSHIDTWDPAVLWGGLSDYAALYTIRRYMQASAPP